MSKRSEKSTPHSTDRKGNFDFKVCGFASPGNNAFLSASRGKGSSGKKHKLYEGSNYSLCSPSGKKLKVNNFKSNYNDVNSKKVKNGGNPATKVLSVYSSDIISKNDSNPADDIGGDNCFRDWDIQDIFSGCDGNSFIKRGSGSKIDKVLLQKFASPISVPSAFSSLNRVKTLPLISLQTPVATKTFTKQQIGPIFATTENENKFFDNQTRGSCRRIDLTNIDSQCSRGNKLTKISKDKQIHSKKKELLNLSCYFNEGSDSDDSQSTVFDKSTLKSQHFMISDESPKKSSLRDPGSLNISISTSRNASPNDINQCSLSIDFDTQESVEVGDDSLGCIQIQEYLTPVKNSDNFKQELTDDENCGDNCPSVKRINVIRRNLPIRYVTDNQDSCALTPVKHLNVRKDDKTLETYRVSTLPYKAVEILKKNSPVFGYFNNQLNENNNDLTPVKESFVNISDEIPIKEPTGVWQPSKSIKIIKMNSPVVRHLNDQFSDDSNDLTPVKETHVNINDETPEKGINETQVLYKPIDILKKKSPVVRCIMEKDHSNYNLTCIKKSSRIQLRYATPEKLCQVCPSLISVDLPKKCEPISSEDFTPTSQSNAIIPDETSGKGTRQNPASYSITKLIKRNTALNGNPVLNVDDSNSPLSPRNIDIGKDQATNFLTNDTNWIRDNINEFEFKNRLSGNSFKDLEMSEEVTPIKHRDISFLHKVKLESVKIIKKEINNLNSNKAVNFNVKNENALEDIEKNKVPFKINYDALALIQNDETPQNSQEIFISDNTPMKNHQFNIIDESTPTKLNMDIINQPVLPLNLGKNDKFSLTISKVKKKQSFIINRNREIDINVKVNSNDDEFGENLNNLLEYTIDAFPSPSKDASVMPCDQDNALTAYIPGLTPRKNQIPVENTDQGIIYFSRKKKKLLKSATLLSKAVMAVNNLKSRRKLFSYEIQVGLRLVKECATSDLLKIIKTWKDHSSYYVQCQLPSQNHLSSLQFPTHSVIFVLNEKPKDICNADLLKIYYPVQIFECPNSTNTLIGIAYYLEFIKNELSINELTNQNRSKSQILSMDNYRLTDIFQKSLKPNCHQILLNSARSECISEAIVNSSLTRSISLKVKVLHSVLSDSNIYFAAVDSSEEMCLIEFILDSNIMDILKDMVNVQPVDCFFNNMKFNRKESVLENNWIRNLFEFCHYKVFEKDSLVYTLVPHDDWSPSQHFIRL